MLRWYGLKVNSAIPPTETGNIMKKRQHSIEKFESARLSDKACHKAKGGHKYSPTGAGFQGTFIWETVDVRGLMGQKHESENNGINTLSQIGG